MNCENCGNEIEDFAICSDCEIELRNGLTEREKEIIYFALSRLLDSLSDQAEFNELDNLRDKFKTPNNQSIPKNPSEQDECKSVQ